MVQWKMAIFERYDWRYTHFSLFMLGGRVVGLVHDAINKKWLARSARIVFYGFFL